MFRRLLYKLNWVYLLLLIRIMFNFKLILLIGTKVRV